MLQSSGALVDWDFSLAAQTRRVGRVSSLKVLTVPQISWQSR